MERLLCDRSAERERDLADIAHLLDAFVDDDSDRRFEEAIGQDFEVAPAYLLGLDIGGVVGWGIHKAIVERFLQTVRDPESVLHAIMQGVGPRCWRSDVAG